MPWKKFDLFTDTFRGKNILIAGYGREGKSSHAFVLPYAKNIWVTDARPLTFDDAKTAFIAEENLHQITPHVDLVIKSPGYPIKKLQLFTPEQLTSQVDLFLQWFHEKVIGVTGTKGKSTLSSLIHHLLRENGQTALLGGNIGVPVLDLLVSEEPAWVVLELSANQLEILHTAPHVALFNNLYEEHLDYFGTFENYANAKWQIILKQQENDFGLLHASLLSATEVRHAKSQLMLYGQHPDKVLPQGMAATPEAFIFFNNALRTIYPFNPQLLPLLGQHNIENCSGALLASWLCGVPIEKAIESLYTFTPLPHRLEKVGTFKNITFVNDSISTIPQATIAALESLNNVYTLILGGYDRGIDYQPLVDYLKTHPTSPALLLLLGQSGKRLKQMFIDQQISQPFYWVENLELAVKKAYELTPPFHICLLSPASASYDQFTNFEERGNAFKELCKHQK